MSEIRLTTEILALPPEERIVTAGLTLLKQLRKMPTQDQVVHALSGYDGTKGTGKGTVNKYWPSLQRKIAQELSLVEWLPEKLPESVINCLKQLMDWARQEAQTQLDVRQAHLDARERALNDETKARDERDKVQRENIDALTKALNQSEANVQALREHQSSLEQSAAEQQRTLAVQHTQLSHAAEREASALAQIQSLQGQAEQLNNTLTSKEEALQSSQKDKNLLENQLHTLQHQQASYLQTLSQQKSQIKTLEQHQTELALTLSASQQSNQAAQAQLQERETQLAKQAGQLALLTTLTASVDAVKAALDKEQQRTLTLEHEKKHLLKRLRYLENQRTIKPKRL